MNTKAIPGTLPGIAFVFIVCHFVFIVVWKTFFKNENKPFNSHGERKMSREKRFVTFASVERTAVYTGYRCLLANALDDKLYRFYNCTIV